MPPPQAKKGSGGGVLVVVGLLLLGALGAGGWYLYPLVKAKLHPETDTTANAVAVTPGSTPTVPAASEPPANAEPPASTVPANPPPAATVPETRHAIRPAEPVVVPPTVTSTNRVAAERAAAERAAAEAAAAVAAEKAASERAAAEREAAERLAAERAEALRRKREADTPVVTQSRPVVTNRTTVAPPVIPAGPSSGAMTWRGRLAKNETVTVTGLTASGGDLEGTPLPGVPVVLESNAGCAVSSAPAPSNGFKQFAFRCKKSGQLTVEFHWSKP